MLIKATPENSTLVYVEGEARMNTYEDADRGKQSRLDLIQRKLQLFSATSLSPLCTGSSSTTSSYLTRPQAISKSSPGPAPAQKHLLVPRHTPLRTIPLPRADRLISRLTQHNHLVIIDRFHLLHCHHMYIWKLYGRLRCKLGRFLNPVKYMR